MRPMPSSISSVDTLCVELPSPLNTLDRPTMLMPTCSSSRTAMHGVRQLSHLSVGMCLATQCSVAQVPSSNTHMATCQRTQPLWGWRQTRVCPDCELPGIVPHPSLPP